MANNEATVLTRSEKRSHMAALGYLLFLGGMALAGPSGVLAWGENVSLLDQRKTEIAAMSGERNELKNRVELLDPKAVDPDLAAELIRRNLNVVHPDEVVITLR